MPHIYDYFQHEALRVYSLVTAFRILSRTVRVHAGLRMLSVAVVMPRSGAFRGGIFSRAHSVLAESGGVGSDEKMSRFQFRTGVAAY